jgi:hypothetical protein
MYLNYIQLQDNEQHDPEDATEVEGGMVDGSVGSADEVDVLTAAIQNVEVQEDLNGDDDSDEEHDQTVMIKSGDAIADDDLSKFQRFNVVKSHPDHHYIDTTHEVGACTKTWTSYYLLLFPHTCMHLFSPFDMYICMLFLLPNQLQGSSGGRRWVKTVQKEWKILENSLPGTYDGTSSRLV